MKTFFGTIKVAFAALPLLASSQIEAQDVTVNLTKTYQTIRGFGGMHHRQWQTYDLNASDRNLAFGNGPGQIGLTMLRIPVYTAQSDWSRELALAKDVIARGGLVYASSWVAPNGISNPYTFQRWGATVNSFKIPASNYGAYANHLNAFAKYMKDNGAPLYAIGFQNEPDWAGGWTHWTVDEVYNFTKNHAARLRLNGTKVISAEAFSYDKAYYDKIINDPSALSNIDVLGAHFYGSDAKSSNTFFQYPLADQKAMSKERWMTEHYSESKGNANMWKGYIVTGDQDQTPKYDSVRALDVGYEIHRGLVEGNFSQYTWWYIRRNYGLIMHDATASVKPTPVAADVGKVTKRGYIMAQYAKFVRPGAVRVDATKNPVAHAYVSAFKKGDSVVIVVVNRNVSRNLKFSVPGATNITSWKKYTTSANKNVSDDGSVTATGGNFSTSIDQESIVTLVGVGTASSIKPNNALNAGSAPGLYKVFSVSGALIGQVNLAEGMNLNAEVRKLSPKSGLYLAKSPNRAESIPVSVLP